MKRETRKMGKENDLGVGGLKGGRVRRNSYVSKGGGGLTGGVRRKTCGRGEVRRKTCGRVPGRGGGRL